MSEGAEQHKVFNLVGGHLCLDFANTVGSHVSEQTNEHLVNYATLLAWGAQAGAIDEVEAHTLRQASEERPEDAQAVLERAIELREAIYRMFSAIAAEKTPNEADLELLNTRLGEGLAHLRLVPEAEGFGWAWAPSKGALDRVLWPVVRSAADLLTEGTLSRVRECSGDTCGWLFVDMSRNRSRRWCDMEDCGNRAKARRHYHRQRVQGSGIGG